MAGAENSIVPELAQPDLIGDDAIGRTRKW
jgi:hypothetical protein